MTLVLDVDRKRGRPSKSVHVSIEDHAATDFLDVHAQVATGHQGLWPYSRGKSEDWKKSVSWSEVKKIGDGKLKMFKLINRIRKYKHVKTENRIRKTRK